VIGVAQRFGSDRAAERGEAALLPAHATPTCMAAHSAIRVGDAAAGRDKAAHAATDAVTGAALTTLRTMRVSPRVPV